MRKVLYVLLSPVALPILGVIVAYQAWARAQGWRVANGRDGTWYWRMWWFYGYWFGLYRLDWWMKGRRSPRRIDGKTINDFQLFASGGFLPPREAVLEDHMVWDWPTPPAVSAPNHWPGWDASNLTREQWRLFEVGLH